MDLDDSPTTAPILRERVARRAGQDATRYTAELGHLLDTSRPDWSSAAWAAAQRDLSLTSREAADLWPVYLAALVSGSEAVAELDAAGRDSGQ